MSTITRQFDVDDIDLNSIDYVFVRDVDSTNLPNVQVNSGSSVTSDGGVTTDLYYKDKQIEVRLDILAPSFEDMENSYAEILETCKGANKVINFDRRGDRVVYTANLENVRERNKGGGYVRLELMFVAKDPIATSAGYFNTTDTIISTGNNTDFSVGGTYYAKPIITATINSLTVTNPATITLAGSTRTINITRDWAAGEVLVIDGEAGTVTVDGTVVSYAGYFPDLAPGFAQLSYSDTFTLRNISLLVIYKHRYL